MTRPPSYDCREAFRRIDDYVDRELTPAEIELVREHLAACVECAREFRFEEFVLQQARAKLSRIVAPPGLLDRIREGLKDKP